METNNDLSIPLEINNLFQNTDLCYFYQGEFSDDITKNFLEFTETSLNKVEELKKIKKKIYFVMIESLQNIVKHQDHGFPLNPNAHPGMFMIRKMGKQYYVSAGNLVKTKKIPALREKLTKINQLNTEELRAYYLNKLADDEFTDQGGAGIGLIEIAKLSKNKLYFDFSEIDDKTSFYYLLTRIGNPQMTQDTNNKQPEDHANNLQIASNNSAFHIKKVHNTLHKRGIEFLFQGIISQENLIGILSVINNHVYHYEKNKALANVMIEMIQNIVKHGYKGNYRDISGGGAPGIMIIKNNETNSLLLTGNYIHNDHLSQINSHIKEINNTSLAELQNTYDSMLYTQSNRNKSNAGLGLIKIRLKSKNPIFFKLDTITHDYSFLSLQVTI